MSLLLASSLTPRMTAVTPQVVTSLSVTVDRPGAPRPTPRINLILTIRNPTPEQNPFPGTTTASPPWRAGGAGITGVRPRTHAGGSVAVPENGFDLAFGTP